jgi:AcrR family transcriptional regulator
MDKREAILKAADTVFAGSGFGLAGVDALAAAAGVTKRTLYKQFGSKAGLFEAWLERRDQATRAMLFGAVEKRATAPLAQVLALFEVLASLARDGSFHGCPFSRALIEIRDRQQSSHLVATRHKAELHLWFTERVQAAGLTEVEERVEGLMTLYEGVLQRVAATGSSSAAHAAIQLISKVWP